MTGSRFRRTSRLTVDGLRLSRAAMARTVRPASTPSAISSRSASLRNRSDRRGGWSMIGVYVLALPAELMIVRPRRQRVPVLRLTPTILHAALFEAPFDTSSMYKARCSANGGPPGALGCSRRSDIAPPGEARCCNDPWNPPDHTQVTIGTRPAVPYRVEILKGMVGCHACQAPQAAS